ncbi:MAG TPA: hypothetical protein VHH15_14150 [Actinophytocola sp.]|nr:hypothetical protein [Actinophytocola sp.]
MTENGARTLYLHTPCPKGMPCHGAPPEPSVEHPAYRRDELNNEEAAEVVAARTAADRTVAAARPEIDAGVAALLDHERAAADALRRLHVFLQGGALARRWADVRRVWHRHRSDGAEDRRVRPAWAKWALWLAVPAAGLYDTAFFAVVFLTLVDVEPSPTNPVFYVALLPGVMVTVALLVAGHWLGEALFRSRERAERSLIRKRRRRPHRQRERDDLPWARWWLPTGFGLLVLGTLALWAVLRARDSQTGAVSTPTDAVTLLLLLFSVTAIAVKAIYHNPHADSARGADRRLAAAGATGDTLATDAGVAVAAFAAANERLRGLLAELTAQGSRHLDQAWEHILRRRHEHGRAGPHAPVFEPGRRRPLFGALAEPPLWTEPIEDGRQLLRDDEVTAARERLEHLRAELVEQCAEVTGSGRE